MRAECAISRNEFPGVSGRCSSFVRRRESNHVSRLGRFSKLRQKMPSCPMHLADTMKFRSLSNRTYRYRLRQHFLHKRIAWQMDDTVECGARDSVHPEMSSSVRESTARVCVRETQRAPAGGESSLVLHLPSSPALRRHRGETDFSVEKPRRHSKFAGKCSFRDIDADRNNFAGDSDLSSNPRSDAPGFTGVAIAAVL